MRKVTEMNGSVVVGGNGWEGGKKRRPKRKKTRKHKDILRLFKTEKSSAQEG